MRVLPTASLPIQQDPVLLVIRGLDGLCINVVKWQELIDERPDIDFRIMFYLDADAGFTGVYDLRDLISDDYGRVVASGKDAVYLRRFWNSCSMMRPGRIGNVVQDPQVMSAYLTLNTRLTRINIENLYNHLTAGERQSHTTTPSLALPYEALNCSKGRHSNANIHFGNNPSTLMLRQPPSPTTAGIGPHQGCVNCGVQHVRGGDSIKHN